jgi:hypothetical protein
MSLTVSFFDAYVLLLPLAARDARGHPPAPFPGLIPCRRVEAVLFLLLFILSDFLGFKTEQLPLFSSLRFLAPLQVNAPPAGMASRTCLDSHPATNPSQSQAQSFLYLCKTSRNTSTYDDHVPARFPSDPAPPHHHCPASPRLFHAPRAGTYHAYA